MTGSFVPEYRHPSPASSLDLYNDNNSSTTSRRCTATPDRSDLVVKAHVTRRSRVSPTGLTYTAAITSNGPHQADQPVFHGDITGLLDTIHCSERLAGLGISGRERDHRHAGHDHQARRRR